MGLFDSLQNLINGAAGSLGDAVGGLPEIPGIQDLQDQATTLTDGASETITSLTEQAQTTIKDATQNLGL